MKLLIKLFVLIIMLLLSKSIFAINIEIFSDAKDYNIDDTLYYSKLIMLQLEFNKPVNIEDNFPLRTNIPIQNESFIQNETLSNMQYDEVFTDIINCSKEVYNYLGRGWGESTYREALTIELSKKGYICSQEVSIPIIYKEIELSHVNLRIDILAKKNDKNIIIELKADSASKTSMEKATCQCERYMKLHKTNYGIVINFPDKKTDQIESNIIEY